MYPDKSFVDPGKFHIVKVTHIDGGVRHFFFKAISGGKRRYVEAVVMSAGTIARIAAGSGTGIAVAGTSVAKAGRHGKKVSTDYGQTWRDQVLSHFGNDPNDYTAKKARMQMEKVNKTIRCFGFLEQVKGNSYGTYGIWMRDGFDQDSWVHFLQYMSKSGGEQQVNDHAFDVRNGVALPGQELIYVEGGVGFIDVERDPGLNFLEKAGRGVVNKIHKLNTRFDQNQSGSSSSSGGESDGPSTGYSGYSSTS